ncbi:MAG: ABC transporter ATP-binding protein [Chloroflexi bacterium]|nr:ABC transporter ATP-binding protein [Chloroflexota bacterium]
MVRFEHVSKRYQLGGLRRSLRELLPSLVPQSAARKKDTNDFWALNDVSFSLKPGEALGLIGPNGAGKTTILRLLAGITRPTSGQITVDGRLAALIELGAGFHPDLTGRENIYLNGSILGLRRAETARLFDSIVAFSGLERFLDTPVKRYSSGMYVRLGFSIAAHIEPDILLVDEVLAVGDAQFRMKCIQRLRELRARGTTIVFVSHNPYQVKSACERALFIQDGTIRFAGDTVDAINEYEAWQHRQQRDGLMATSSSEDGSRGESSGPIRITNVEVCGLDGLPCSEFSHVDAATFKIHFVAHEPVPSANVIARITQSDGSACCEVRARDAGCEIGTLSGQGLISITIDPLQLSGGAYNASAEIEGQLEGMSLAMAYSKWFYVTGATYTPSEFRGVFVPHLTSITLDNDSLATPPTAVYSNR